MSRKPEFRTKTRREQVMEYLFMTGWCRHKDLISVFSRATLAKYLRPLMEEGWVLRMIQGKSIFYTVTQRGKEWIARVRGDSEHAYFITVVKQAAVQKELQAAQEFYRQHGTGWDLIATVLDALLELDWDAEVRHQWTAFLIALLFVESNAVTAYPTALPWATLYTIFQLDPQSVQAKRVGFFVNLIIQRQGSLELLAEGQTYYLNPKRPWGKLLRQKLEEIAVQTHLMQALGGASSNEEAMVKDILDFPIVTHRIFHPIFREPLKTYIIKQLAELFNAGKKGIENPP